MDIKYFGDSSFMIKSKGCVFVTDPFSSSKTGIKFPKIQADIVTFSNGIINSEALGRVEGSPLIINLAGEYEKRGIRIQGYTESLKTNDGKKTLLYKAETEGMTLLHCGGLDHVLSDEMVEELDVIDILFIGAGGVGEFTTKQAVEIVRKIEPSIVIPMHFIDVADFLTQMQVSTVEPLKKLTIKQADLTEDTKVILLQQA